MGPRGTAHEMTPALGGTSVDVGLQVLTRVAEQLAGATDESTLGAALVEGGLALSGLAASVWLADPDATGGLRCVATGHRDEAEAARLTQAIERLEPANSALTAVLRTGRPSRVGVIDLRVTDGEVALTQDFDLGPAVLVPLRAHRTTVGVLAVARPAIGPGWSAFDVEALCLAGRHAASSLERLRSGAALAQTQALALAERVRAGDLLEAMDTRAALLGADGIVVAANSRWRAAVADRSGTRAHVVPPEASWTDFLDTSNSAAVREFSEQVRAVLRGDQDVARLDEREDESATEVVALPGTSGTSGTPEAPGATGEPGGLPRPGSDGVAVVLQSDASWRRRLEDELTHRALHDELTGLPNRAALREGLEASLSRLGEGDLLAVLFCDLDGFKDINDGLGHAVGDQVLVAVARRLRQRCRSADIVARFGGDEFVIVLPVPDVGQAIALADRLVEVLGDPIVVGDAEVAPGASIGITVVDRPPPGKDPVGTLLRDADTAMYHAKQRGRGRFEFFDASLRIDIATRLELASALRHADMDTEFSLRYQARRFCGTRGLAGVEALLCWQTPAMVGVMPADFVPIAERTGRIVPIGQWVLDRALQEVALLGPAGLPVAVNVSPRQLGAPGFVDSVARALADSAISPARLLLEITESALVDDPAAARSVLTELRRLDVQVALDDFGTGWSSLSYLRDLPVDVIKIDKSFVADLPHDPDACAVVAGVLGLGHGMGLVVVAEGVERPDQLEVLRDMGCDEYQGFIDGEPGPLARVVADATRPAQ